MSDPAHPHKDHPIGYGLLVFLGALALSVLFFLTAWQHPTTTVAGGGGDPLQTIWFFGFTAHELSHGHNPLTTTVINFPFGINQMWNTGQPLAAAALAPVTLSMGAVFSYNLEVTLCLALATWTAYLALRRLIGGHLGPIAGAVLFGFSPYLTAQALGHANLLQIWTLPLFIILLDDILVHQSRVWRADGFLLALLAAIQLGLSEEVLLIELISCGLATLALAVVQHRLIRIHLRHALSAVGLGAGLALLFCAYPLYVQFFGEDRSPALQHSSGAFVSDILGFFIPTANQVVAPHPALDLSQHFSGNASEYAAYLGIPLLAVIGYALWHYRRIALVRVVGAASIAMALLSMGADLHLRGHDTGIPLPWHLVSGLPILGDVLTSRMMLAVDLGAAVLLALVLGDLASQRTRRSRTVALGIVVIVAVSLAPHTVGARPFPTTPAAFTAADTRPLLDGHAVLVLPLASATDAVPMAWQITDTYQFSMIGGYVLGPSHPDTVIGRLSAILQIDSNTMGVAAPVMQDATSYRSALLASGISTIVLVPGMLPAANQQLLETAASKISGAAPVADDGVLIWRLGAG